MKSKYLILSFVILFLQSTSQIEWKETLNKYNSEKSKQAKANCLAEYIFAANTNDSIVYKKAFNLLEYFVSIPDYFGANFTELIIVERLNNRQDFASALNIGLPLLSKFIKSNDTLGTIKMLEQMALSYERTKNFEMAIIYLKKKIPYEYFIGNETELAYTFSWIGAIYAQDFLIDSGMVYGQKALNIATKLNDETLLAYSFSTMAENYIANKDYDLAMPYLRRALNLGVSNTLDIDNIGYIYNDFSQAFLYKKDYDSTKYYAYKAIPLFISTGRNEQLLRSYEYIYKSFDELGKIDSANRYFRLATLVKDSIYSSEKIKAIESISFREQLHQQELKIEKNKVVEERKNNIQYTLIAAGILILLLLFLLLSRSFITNSKIISFIGVVALLIVFEFVNLLLHPFLGRITHHVPLLMLLSMVIIAAMLVPLHHKLEKWMTKTLIEKNKAIRLREAKKTIEELQESKEISNKEN